MNDAMSVIKTPLNQIPLLRFPVSSTSPKALGKSPCSVRANCRRGCAMTVTNATIGRHTTSPSAQICDATFQLFAKNAEEKPLVSLISSYGCIPVNATAATMYKVVMNVNTIMTARGIFFSGLIASPETQQTSSKPRYPKKEVVAPRMTPLTPYAGGTNGSKLSAFINANPPKTMSVTTAILIVVKTFVTVLDSLTPLSKSAMAATDIKNAIGLKDSPGYRIPCIQLPTFISTCK
mmetsp:Transcript_15402/g.23865  ORF Transcript_15402/g.23865 Transcript_15402/m.23865 type:complete len:235 (+) Transcript_15402:823-1527(+)